MILTFVMQFFLTLGKSSTNVWKFDEGASLPLNATAQHKATNVYSSVSRLYMQSFSDSYSLKCSCI